MQVRIATLLMTTVLLMLALLGLLQTPIRAQEISHTFPETGKTVRGIFLQYWTTHGGLAQQGYPISDEMMLTSTDGKEYRTQFFQRAVFEHHPEFAGTSNEVLLKLVGQTFYERHFQTTPPSNQAVNPTNTLTFKETGHSIGGKFRDYWEKHGGLAQQGYPMTGEFKMASTDGKEYTTQVFQRAVFELHPEFAGTENEVLLRLLGVEELEVLNRPVATATPKIENPAATPTKVRLLGGQYDREVDIGNGEMLSINNPDNNPDGNTLYLTFSDDDPEYSGISKEILSQVVKGRAEITILPPGSQLVKGRSYRDRPVNGFLYHIPNGPVVQFNFTVGAHNEFIVIEPFTGDWTIQNLINDPDPNMRNLKVANARTFRMVTEYLGGSDGNPLDIAEIYNRYKGYPEEWKVYALFAGGFDEIDYRLNPIKHPLSWRIQ